MHYWVNVNICYGVNVNMYYWVNVNIYNGVNVNMYYWVNVNIYYWVNIDMNYWVNIIAVRILLAGKRLSELIRTELREFEAHSLSHSFTLSLPHSLTPSSLKAKCIKTGPKTHVCQCLKGWAMDQDECQPINDCNGPGRGGCHGNASCIYIGPGQVRMGDEASSLRNHISDQSSRWTVLGSWSKVRTQIRVNRAFLCLLLHIWPWPNTALEAGVPKTCDWLTAITNSANSSKL